MFVAPRFAEPGRAFLGSLLPRGFPEDAWAAFVSQCCPHAGRPWVHNAQRPGHKQKMARRKQHQQQSKSVETGVLCLGPARLCSGYFSSFLHESFCSGALGSAKPQELVRAWPRRSPPTIANGLSSNRVGMKLRCAVRRTLRLAMQTGLCTCKLDWT